MDLDDRPVGQVLSRREALRLIGLGGAAILAACTRLPSGEKATPSAAGTTGARPTGVLPTVLVDTGVVPACVMRPEMTEGPYFVDEKLNRSDIRSNPDDGSVEAGMPLNLTFLVSSLAKDACTPLAGAQVDVWHCNALGVYSDVGGGGSSSAGKKFLRGYQLTGEHGKAEFLTIYPGWYPGRTVHIHFKIRTAAASGQSYEFTSQLFFDDAFSDQVFTNQPYAGRGERDVRNTSDGIFRSGGDQLLLAPEASGDGYAAVFAIALDLGNA